ncbi:MAG: hypothetical protein Q4Q23_00315 [Methanobacteriaceae archaeon]|nr:hypothetical protein [Methanobacteriaceae archaeon]
MLNEITKKFTKELLKYYNLNSHKSHEIQNIIESSNQLQEDVDMYLNQKEIIMLSYKQSDTMNLILADAKKQYDLLKSSIYNLGEDFDNDLKSEYLSMIDKQFNLVFNY